jgi:hypothetical protein
LRLGKSWVSSLTLVKLVNIFEIEVYELFRPVEAVDDETKELINRFAKDISVSFNQPLGSR